MSVWFGLRFVGWVIIGSLCLQAACYNPRLGLLLVFIALPLLVLGWHWVLIAAEALYNQNEGEV